MKTFIYLTDDDEDDRLLIREALHRIDPDVSIVETENGLQLLDILGRLKENTQGSSLPNLIILDMNMPKLSGLNVLKKLRAMPALRHTPVVLFSTSNRPEQAREAYREGVNACIQKPHDLDEYERIAQSLITQFLKYSPKY